MGKEWTVNAQADRYFLTDINGRIKLLRKTCFMINIIVFQLFSIVYTSISDFIEKPQCQFMVRFFWKATTPSGCISFVAFYLMESYSSDRKLPPCVINGASVIAETVSADLLFESLVFIQPFDEKKPYHASRRKIHDAVFRSSGS